jgi:hypothetical protein
MVYTNIKQIREVLKNIYAYRHSKTWAKRVDKMADAQVLAIYISFQKRGLIE